MKTNIFEKAMNAYVEVMNTAKEMFKVHQDALESEGKQFSVRVALNQLDVIIQYSMLQIALNDNNLDKNEVLFIKTMSQYCDFCDFLNQCGYKNVTWDVIYNSDEQVLKQILKETLESVVSLSNDFIKVFSLIDAMIKERNYLEILYNDFCSIIAAVMQADGKVYKEELSRGCLLVDLINVISEQKEEAENDIKANKEKLNNKIALKNYYINKNNQC